MTKLVKKNQDTAQDYLPHVLRIADIAQNFKAGNLKAYDVQAHTSLTDCIFMCSCTSDPQLKAIFNGIKDGMKEVGVRPFHTEGQSDSSWILIDYGSIFVHIFKEAAYEFYDLDGFWADAEVIDLELDGS
ncbi:MAG: ribosome silencing factor [Candidatus Hydrogenedentota bacterium]